MRLSCRDTTTIRNSYHRCSVLPKQDVILGGKELDDADAASTVTTPNAPPRRRKKHTQKGLNRRACALLIVALASSLRRQRARTTLTKMRCHCLRDPVHLVITSPVAIYQSTTFVSSFLAIFDRWSTTLEMPHTAANRRMATAINITPNTEISRFRTISKPAV